jgi:hypothetical protein
MIGERLTGIDTRFGEFAVQQKVDASGLTRGNTARKLEWWLPNRRK